MFEEIAELNPQPKAFGSRCHIHSTAVDQACANGALVTVRFDTVRWDNLGEFDPSLGVYAFTPSTRGLYEIYSHIYWRDSPGGGISRLYIYVNGAWRIIDAKIIVANFQLGQEIRLVDFFTENDDITIRVIQTTGAVKNIWHDWRLTYLIIRRVG